MKDPKVTELVKQFKKDVDTINKSLAALQKNDVYVRLDIKGTNSYNDPKYVQVTQITQHVEYMKDDAQ